MSRAHVPIYARPRHQNPEIAKPASKGGSAIPAGGRETLDLADRDFPDIAEFSKPFWRAPVKCAQNQPLPGGCCCTPEAPCLPLSPSPLTSTAR